MNTTPCARPFFTRSATSASLEEVLLNEMAANSPMTTNPHPASGTHATHAMDACHEPSDPPAPIPAREHALVIALMRAFAGISPAESTVYRHIRDNPRMSGAEQASLQLLLGDGCPMLDYCQLGQSLILGLAAQGREATYAAAAREVIIANALRDLRKQPHKAAMMAHTRLLVLLHEQHWLKHVKANVHMLRITQLAEALQATSGRRHADIRAQIIQAEPLRDALLAFVLAEASA